jgi:hypothetical protein
MKTTDKRITILSYDIRQAFANVFGEKADMSQLCRDHHDPFLLPDKKPVLNIIQDELIGIFNMSSNHYFLSAGQVLRLGTYCNLALPNLIAMMLKAEWEEYLSGMPGISTDTKLRLTDQNLIERYISDFKPNPGKLFNHFRRAGDVTPHEITYIQIEYFISDMMEKSKFLFANHFISQFYSNRKISEEILLHNITGQQEESYHRLKELWLTKSTELDDLLMYLERKKRINLSLENKYFRIFGSLEAGKSKFVYQLKKYKIIIEIMHDNPEFSLRELIISAGERLTVAIMEQNDIKNKITRSLNRIDFALIDVTKETISEDFKNSYMQECKKLLRKLFFLLHTDTCPNYSEFPGHKKAEINKLWLKLMKSTKEEMYSFSPSMLLYSLPDYEQIKSIYVRACEILGMDPDCYDTGNRLEFMISKGASIESILEFLKKETGQLELHLARLELVQNEYTHEDQSRLYRQAIEDMNGHTERLKSEVSDLKKQIVSLKKQITNEYAKVTGQ